jgi:hypothetical protein
LKFTTSVAHHIVDDDSDHVDAHDHSGAPGQAQVQTKTVSWRLDLLKDKQIADTYRAQIKDLSHAVIDAIRVPNIDQHQVDKVFEQVADVTQGSSVRSVARSVRDGTAAWWTQEYAVIRPRHRRRRR